MMAMMVMIFTMMVVMMVTMSSEIFRARLNRFGFEILVENAKRRFWQKMGKAV